MDFVTLALAKKYARQKISELGNVLRFNGTKATYAEIEAIEDPQVGDVWHCTADGGEYAYTTSGTWMDLGNDLSGYLAKADLANNVTGTSEETAPTQKAVKEGIDSAETVIRTVDISAGTTGTATAPTGKSFVGYAAFDSTGEQVLLEISTSGNTTTFTASATGTYSIFAYFK